MRHGHIGPIVPRRHPHLTGKLVDAVDGSAAVAAGDHQLAALGCDDKLLAFPHQVLLVDDTFAHQLVDGLGVAQRTDHDRRLFVGSDSGREPAHALNIGGQIVRGTAHTPLVVVVQIDEHRELGVQTEVAFIEKNELLS